MANTVSAARSSGASARGVYSREMKLRFLVACAAAATACGAFGADSPPSDPATRDPVGPVRDLASAQQTPGAIVVDASTVYWINQASAGNPGALMKLAKSGGDPIILKSALPGPYALTSDATRLYVSANDTSPGASFQNIYLQDKAGGDAVRLQLTANDQVFGCSAQVGKVFWVLQSSGGQVGLVEPDSWTTTSILPIAKDLGAVKTVAATSTHVFVGGAGSVLKVDRTTGDKSMFATTEGAVQALVLDTATMVLYWADGASIQKRGVDSPDPAVVLAAGQSGPSAIAVDAANVYWTNADGTVKRVPKAGGAPTTISTDETEPLGIAVDVSGVYWTNHGDGRIRFYPR
jgi:hypothetical protein